MIAYAIAAVTTPKITPLNILFGFLLRILEEYIIQLHSIRENIVNVVDL